MTFPCDMVDMEMVDMDLEDMDMVDMDMVDMDMVDVYQGSSRGPVQSTWSCCHDGAHHLLPDPHHH